MGSATTTGVLAGAAAGAAGTTALNAVTYLDMVVRGRPSSSTPEQTVTALTSTVGLQVPGQGEKRENRTSGLGALLGIAAGVATGAAWGALRELGVRLPLPAAVPATAVSAMVAGSAPMTLLKVTDPRTWTPSEWLADVVPHLAYGAVTAVVLRGLARGR